MTQLTKYDAARQALEIAATIDEVSSIHDKAEAMAIYGRRAKDTTLVAWATEIRIRAERKAGEMLLEMEKNQGGNPSLTGHTELPVAPTPAKRSQAVTVQPTLKQLGITKRDSANWQKIARIPEAKFEDEIFASRVKPSGVTTAAMLKLVEAESKPSKETKPSERETVSHPTPEANKDAGVDSELPKKEAVDDENYDPKQDEIKEMQHAIADLGAENEALNDRLAVVNMDEDKLAVMEKITGLRSQIKTLEAELDAVKAMRDSLQIENAEMKKQLKVQRNQIAKLKKG